MAKNKEQELAPKQEQPLVVYDPKDLTDSYGEMNADHVNIPRLVVLESLSPEIREKAGSAGELLVKSLNRNLGPGPIEVVVLSRTSSQIKWKPLNDGGGIVCKAEDGKTGTGDPGGDCSVCPQRQWQGQGKAPLCDQYENFLVVLREDLKNGDAFPMAISGSRSRLKKLKDLNTQLMTLVQRRLPLFAKSFKLSVIEKANPKFPANVYHIFSFAPGNDNKQLPEEEQRAAYELFKSFKGKKIIVEQDQQEVPEQEAAF